MRTAMSDVGFSNNAVASGVASDTAYTSDGLRFAVAILLKMNNTNEISTDIINIENEKQKGSAMKHYILIKWAS